MMIMMMIVMMIVMLIMMVVMVQVVYGCMAEQGEDAWQLQVPACDFLHSLTQLLTARMDHFMDLHTRPGSGEVTWGVALLTSPNLTYQRI